jgi:hypothetical protein
MHAYICIVSSERKYQITGAAEITDNRRSTWDFWTSACILGVHQVGQVAAVIQWRSQIRYPHPRPHVPVVAALMRSVQVSLPTDSIFKFERVNFITPMLSPAFAELSVVQS